jgi:hypothetical protein
MTDAVDARSVGQKEQELGGVLIEDGGGYVGLTTG